MQSLGNSNFGNYLDPVSNRQTESQVKSFQAVINDLFTDLSKLMQNVIRFRREHSDSKKQWSTLVKTYVTANYFQNKLISIQEYKQFQKDFNQTLSIIHSTEEKVKKGQYSLKDTQLQFIKDSVNQLKNLSDLITKCQENISSQRSLNQVEGQSKLKSTQHLNQLLEALDVITNNLIKFQQKYEKNQNQQIDTVQREQMVQCEHQNSDKLIKTISNQEILRNLLNLINDVKSPKKQEISFGTSSYKHQIQNLKCYKELKQNVEIMLKQTQKFNQCQSTQKGTKNYKTFMVKKIMESLLKVQFLYEFQSKCTIPEQEFINHLVQITGQLHAVKQNLQKLLAEKVDQKEVCAVLKLTQEISLCLQQKQVKMRSSQNSQKSQIYIPLNDANKINDHLSLIEDNMMKIHEIMKKQEEQLKNNERNTFESKQNQQQSEDQNKTHTENTTKVPCFYSQQQMLEKIRQKLNEQTVKMEDAHKREIETLNNEFENLKNEFETKIKQLQTQLVQKDSQIYQLNQKQQKQQNEIILQKKQSLKSTQINQQHYQRQEDMKNALTKEVQEKRNDKNKLIEEVKELNIKIQELKNKIEQLQSSEATLAVSIEQKKQQLLKLIQKIEKPTQAVNNKTPVQTKQDKKQSDQIQKSQQQYQHNSMQQIQTLKQQLNTQKNQVIEQTNNRIKMLEQKLQHMVNNLRTGDWSKLYLRMKQQQQVGDKQFTEQSITQQKQQERDNNDDKESLLRKDQSQQQHQQQQQQRQRVDKLIDQLSGLIQSLLTFTQDKLTQLETQLKEKINDYNKEQQQNTQLTKVRDQLSRVNQQLQNVKDENQRLSQELTQKTQQFSQINQKFIKYQQQEQDKQKQQKIENQQEPNSQIKTSIITQQQKLQTLRQQTQNLQNKHNDLKTNVAILQASIKEKQQNIQQLNQNQQQINNSFLQTINSTLKQTVEITQLKQQLQYVQTQLSKERQTILTLKQEIKEYKTQIQSLTQNNQSNHNLSAQISTLQQQITKIKAQSQNTIKQLNLQIQRLSSSLQFEKGKNQTNQKEIVSLKESVKTLTDQKIALKLETQRMTLQIKDLLEKEIHLKQLIQAKENQNQVLKIDFEEKTNKLNQIKEQNERKIKTFNDQIVQQKSKIEKQGKQIEGLNNQKKQLQNHVITLQKIQTQKIKLDEKVQQLNKEIKDLQQEIERKNQNITTLNQSIQTDTKNHESQKEKLQKKQLKLKSNYQKQAQSLERQYEARKLKFEKQACEKIEDLVTKFNTLNKNVKQEKKKHQQESLYLSSVLGTIYQAMSKMNEFYQTPSLIKYFNTQSHQNIINCAKQGRVLNQQQCQQVLVYSVKTIKALETRTRLAQKNANNNIKSFDNKLAQIIGQIYNLCNQTDLKISLQQFAKKSKNDQKIIKQQQPKDLVDEVQLSFNSFVQKVVQMVGYEEASTASLINQLSKEKQTSQNELKKKNEEYEKKYKIDAQNNLKVKDQQIAKLNQQLQKANLDLKTQQDLAKKYENDISQKLQQIKGLKAQNQKSSIELNKKIKQQKDKFDQSVKQYKQQIEQLQFNLLSVQSKAQDLQRQLNDSKNSHGNVANTLSATKQQISSLKNTLQDKQKQLTKVKTQLQKNKPQVQRLQQQINKVNSQKSSSQIQASQKQVTIIQLKDQLQKKEQQINDLKKQNQKLQSGFGNNIVTIKAQLATKQSQFQDIQRQLTQNKSLISQITHAMQKKINRKVEPEHLIDELNSYQPPVGMKLIYCGVLHGYDSFRSQIIEQCQKFMGRTIKKTDMLARYPDKNSIIHQLPKQVNNFAFIVFYKTKNNRVFGSFSEGMKKQTFFFSFNWSQTPQSQQQRKIDFYFPKDSSTKYSPVEIFQMKYLQYGNGELRINCIDMTTISANSDSPAGMYYNFDWKTIMNEKEETKVPISEVEVHKVQFETIY